MTGGRARKRRRGAVETIDIEDRLESLITRIGEKVCHFFSILEDSIYYCLLYPMNCFWHIFRSMVSVTNRLSSSIYFSEPVHYLSLLGQFILVM